MQRKDDQIKPEARMLLESYSKIAPDQVAQHVFALRDESYAVYQYACIGQMRFLSFNLSHMPFYPRILALLNSSSTGGFLDAGYCFAQEIRFLANEDEDTLGAKFVTGNLTEPDKGAYQSGALAQELSGKMVAIFTSSLFHFWDYEDQLLVAKRMVAVCEDRPGVMITGSQLGSYLGGRYPKTSMPEDGDKSKNYRHNEQTIRGFWHEVGEATGTQWTVDTATYMAEEIEQTRNAPFVKPNMCMIWWCATRK